MASSSTPQAPIYSKWQQHNNTGRHSTSREFKDFIRYGQVSCIQVEQDGAYFRIWFRFGNANRLGRVCTERSVLGVSINDLFAPGTGTLMYEIRDEIRVNDKVAYVVGPSPGPFTAVFHLKAAATATAAVTTKFIVFNGRTTDKEIKPVAYCTSVDEARAQAQWHRLVFWHYATMQEGKLGVFEAECEYDPKDTTLTTPQSVQDKCTRLLCPKPSTIVPISPSSNQTRPLLQYASPRTTPTQK